MKDFDKLKQILNEPIIINNLNRINDYFVRYLFSHEGNENIALNFINAVFKDLDFETFKKIEILNPSPKAARKVDRCRSYFKHQLVCFRYI